MGVLFHVSADIFIFSLLINIYTYFFIIYYVYRIISKVWLSSNLKINQKYLPGVLPFYYSIYKYEIIENEISLSIEKRSHFSSKKVNKNFITILNTEEMLLFEKGMEFCKANYYYAKWTLFPIFIRNNGIFSVKIFFLETMMSKRTMFIQFDFGLDSQQLIGINRGSGHI